MGAASATRLLDDVDAEQIPAETLAALPAGSVLARGPGSWIRVVQCCADEALLRADGYEHLMAIAWVYARHVDWHLHTARPSRRLLVEVSGLSESTVKRWGRWLRDQGLLAELERGSAPQFRRGSARRAPAHSSVHVLCIPDRWAHARLGQPAPPVVAPPVVDSVISGPGQGVVDRSDPSSLTVLDLEKDPCAHASKPRPLRGPDQSEIDFDTPTDTLHGTGRGDDERGGWSRHAVARTGAERLALAAALQAVSVELARLTTRHLRSELRVWLADPALGWTVHWLQWAIDHAPDGTARTWTSSVHSPAPWLRSRLAAWTGPDGHPVASPGVALAARHQADRDRHAAQRADRARAARQLEVDQQLGELIKAIAGSRYPALLMAACADTPGSSYLPPRARDALVRRAVTDAIPTTTLLDRTDDPDELARVSSPTAAQIRDAVAALVAGAAAGSTAGVSGDASGGNGGGRGSTVASIGHARVRASTGNVVGADDTGRRRSSQPAAGAHPSMDGVPS